MNEKKKERLRSSDLCMMKFLGEAKVKKTMLLRACRGRMKLWILRAIAILSLWTCVIQLVAVGDFRGAKLLKDWPSYVSSPDKHTEESKSFVQPKVHLPPKRSYKNNGHLLVSCNGGLNQMRAAICDMVAIAKYLNITVLVPELDKTSFWADSSDFKDIFDVDHFITSLRDEVQILKKLPSKLKIRVDLGKFYELAPVSWSNISYYHKQILPLLKKYKVVHLNRTDARLANNRLPLEIQKLRCKVNFHSLRFTSQIEELGRKILRRLNGPFLVLHLRYEMDMLSFSGCTRGCNTEEVKELTTMRFANSWWKEKVIDPKLKRKEGLCPLTPEETALVLTALGIDSNTQVYIASGEIYGGTRRLRSLKAAFPNLVSKRIKLELNRDGSRKLRGWLHGYVLGVNKETLLEASDLKFLKNHSSQMAALDYFVSLESDVFVPTYDGNMAKLVEGHRRYLGFKKTILLNRRVLVGLIDKYNDGSLSWDEFSAYVREAHSEDRAGSPKKRVSMENRPKEEDYFYANPEECLPPLDKMPRSL